MGMYEQELRAAIEACRAAGEIQLRCRDAVLRVETKGDNSPVTDVDKACEERIVGIIGEWFPNDGFLGEETGAHPGTSGRLWIVDPLDGTRPYLRGIPTYSALVALQDGEDLAVGVIHLPEMAVTCRAVRGAGAFCNDRPIRVSQTSSLAAAIGSGLGFRENRETAEGKQLFNLMADWGYYYGFMDAYSYVCVASGKLDVCVNLLDKPWDCAAAACIVREAGGRFSDIHGAPTVHNGSVVLSNGLLHDRVLEYFASRAAAA
jgi:histidinol-phosphatase